MVNEIELTTTTDPLTGESTGRSIVTVQLTPHYRKVLREFLTDEAKAAHVKLYEAYGPLVMVAEGTPGIGGAVLTVSEAQSILEAADDEIVETYSISERRLLNMLFRSLESLGI